MARDTEMDNASASSTNGQSKRPAVSRHESETQSETSALPQQQQQQRRQHYPQQQKQHHASRLHARVPSTKALHGKQHQRGHGHGHGHGQVTNAPSATKLSNRKATTPPDDIAYNQPPQRPKTHRRATSDAKLSRQLSGTSLQKSASQSSIKRNRSLVDVGKRNKSADLLKRTSSTTKVHHRTKPSKTQVHFDLGDDEDPEDEWVDASGSTSPYQSRHSLQSSAHSSLRPNHSAANSRPQTPSEPTSSETAEPAEPAESAQPVAPTETVETKETTEPARNEPAEPKRAPTTRDRIHRKEYLTTRLLQRTPSVVAPTKMTVDLVEADPPRQTSRQTSRQSSPDSTLREGTPSIPANTPSNIPGSGSAGVTSRFVEGPSSGHASQASSFYPANGSGPRHSEDLPQRPKSMANLSRSHDEAEIAQRTDDKVDSALVPKPARRTAPLAETSRVQQKLNLQRASSAIEPGQQVSGGGVVGASPLIGVGGPRYDGGQNRDPRVGRLLERIGMEYLVVRRYQNPIARSLKRLDLPVVSDKMRRIPRPNTSSSSKNPLQANNRHGRNVSLPDNRRPRTPKTAARPNGTGSSSYENEDEGRLSERLSGSSLVNEEEDDTSVLLRNLWEKTPELSASTD